MLNKIYDKTNNTFIAKETGEVANKFELEVGDIKQSDFIPQMKLLRWDNECNASFRLIDDDKSKGQVITEDDKIKYVKNKTECHFYQIDKGYEFEVILNEKPKSNLVQMSIETKGLKFYYQPELTQKEIDRGANRPENVVGSYAVYHESKQGDYSKMGLKNYRAGKAFHIYRPKIIDSAGKEVWGNLNIDVEKKLLTVEIPQSFLENAVYPIRHAAGLTFGCDPASPGGSWAGHPPDDLYGSLFTSPASISTAQDISIYAKDGMGNDGGYDLKGVLVLHSNLNIITNGIGGAVAVPEGDTGHWFVSEFGTDPEPSASTDYVLMFIHNGYFSPPSNIECRVAFDTGDTDQGHYDGSNSYASPTDPTDADHNDNKYSLYATYTAGAAEEAGKCFAQII